MILYRSPPQSFFPGLNLPFLQILPTVAFLFFSRTDSMDFPDCLPICFRTFFLFFSLFVGFLVPHSRLSCLTSTIDRTLNSISYRVVSHCILLQPKPRNSESENGTRTDSSQTQFVINNICQQPVTNRGTY